MLKKKKLIICNVTLLVFAIIALASGLAVEELKGETLLGIPYKGIVLIHASSAFTMLCVATYHIHLNLGAKAWWQKIVQQKKIISRLLYIFLILLGLSSTLALIMWLYTFEHNFVGGVHGKIGLAFIFLCVLHVSGRWKWFKSLISSK